MATLTTALLARRLAETNSAWSLLRAANGPVAIAVLSQHLARSTRNLAAPLLFDAVEADLDELRNHGFELPQTAMQYCRLWLNAGYLVRRPSEAREEIYALSEGALVAIRFFEQLADPRPAVTESRLATILDRIHQLNVDTDPDVDQRITALTAQRDAIDARIAGLRAGEVDVLAPDRALERMLDILSLAAELPEDFARVRAALEQINRELRTKLVEEPESRGSVLDDVFRGVDLLGDSEAGRSFAAFYALLLNPEHTASFEDEVDALVQRHFAVALSREQVRVLISFLPDLQAAGGEIDQVMTAFSRSLRRFVQSEELAEDRRVHRLIRETIATGTATAASVQPYREIGFELHLPSVQVNSVSAMRLLNPADSETIEPVLAASTEFADFAALREFVRASEIDLTELTENVNAVLAANGPSTVADVLRARPATQGIASVIGLLVLADEHGTRTAANRTEHVEWTPVKRACDSEEPEKSSRIRGATVPEYLFEELLNDK